MMEDHFGLERAPFRLGTDASFYYEAEAHRRAMAHLRYGLRQAEGFVVITGDLVDGDRTAGHARR